MGTEVLRPQDCLRPTPAFVLHDKRNPSPKPSPSSKQQYSRKPASVPRKRRDGPAKASSGGGDLLVGQVTLLKHGKQPLDEPFGTGLLGPVPEMIPRRNRLAKFPSVAAADEAYAGAAFSVSPAPSALPLPRFSKQKDGTANVNVGHRATMDLRRLLGLE